MSTFIPRAAKRSRSQRALRRQSSRRSGRVLIEGMRSSSTRSARSAFRRVWARATAASARDSVVAIALRLSARATDLVGVLVTVRGVDPQPILGSVTAALAMGPDDAPVSFRHAVEQLCAGLTGPAHRLEGGLDGPVTGQALGETLLVIAVEDRLRFGEKAPDADRGHHLAVRQVVRDLPRRPAVAIAAVQLLVSDVFQRRHHGPISVAVLSDQERSLVGLHPKIVVSYRGRPRGDRPGQED